MRTILLAGGLGARLSSQTLRRNSHQPQADGPNWPPPPPLAHHEGRGIKDHFIHYGLRRNSRLIRLASNQITPVEAFGEDCNSGLIDTGPGTPTGGRVR